MISFSIVLYLIANEEEKISGKKLSNLSYYSASAWYSFAAICQEHVPESNNGRYARAIRLD